MSTQNLTVCQTAITKTTAKLSASLASTLGTDHRAARVAFVKAIVAQL